MSRIVVSFRRSGLNWLRFCVEYKFGIRTHGKKLLISAKDQKEAAFIRDHDPAATSQLRRGKMENAHWLKRIGMRVAFARLKNTKTIAREDDILVLLIRDYREVFVRSSQKNYTHFGGYLSNLRYFTDAPCKKKAVFYYEDYVSDPAKMLEVLKFLEISALSGKQVSDKEFIDAWGEMGEKSRALYSKNQGHRGGAMTKETPLDFDFHKRGLSDDELEELKRVTLETINSEEREILKRYLD